jgi:uncharacterized damage-inducible protein DinB
MKETLLMYARYNIWANKKVNDVLLAQTDAVLDMEIPSSFPSLRQTVYHMWGAENIWLQRIQLAEKAIWKPAGFEGSFAEAVKQWDDTSAQLLAFVEGQRNDDAFNHVIEYYNLKGEYSKIQVAHVLLHGFNHATYHRGQLVTMIRQAGITKIPNTDLFNFANGKK